MLEVDLSSIGLAGLLEPGLVWGLFPRLVGVVFIIAHASMVPQIVAYAGRRGLNPISPRLRSLRAEMGWFRATLHFPTLLWVSDRDLFIWALPIAGLVGGIIGVVGGTWSPLGLLLAWACYMSLDVTGAITAPWDVLLMEMGLIAVLLPAGPLLPSVALEQTVSPAAALFIQWQLVRLMWGFGKVKFVGANRNDRLYLRSFVIWLPFPTAIGWWVNHLPDLVLRGMLAFMFVAEVVAPLLCLIPGWPRLVGGLLLVALMVGIQATGNWGFFNVGYALLCVCFLDVTASVAWLWQTPGAFIATPAEGFRSAVFAFLFFCTLPQLLIFNTWMGRSWMFWPLWDVSARNNKLVQAIVWVYRLLLAIKQAPAYGVFPPQSIPALRQTPLFEGSDDDGKTWKPYRFRYMPTGPHDRPRFHAPHQPRLEHALSFIPLGITDDALMGSLVSYATPPLTYLRLGTLDKAAHRLLEGEPGMLRIFEENPFPNAPPQMIRAHKLILEPSSVSSRRKEGRWWNVVRGAELLPPRQREDNLFETLAVYPELLHPDSVFFRKASRTLRQIEAAASAEASLHDVVLTPAPTIPEFLPLDAGHRAQFWAEAVPHLDLASRSFADVEEVATSFRARFSFRERLQMERILERYVWALRARVLPHVLNAADPLLASRSTFRLHLLLQRCVCLGEDTMEAVYQTPSRLLEVAQDLDLADELIVLGVFRHQALAQLALAMRSSAWNDAARGRKLPSVLAFQSVLENWEPAIERFRPKVDLDDDGHWTVDLKGAEVVDWT